MTVKLFLDTPPLIYFLEDHPAYASPLAAFFTECQLQGITLFTSVVSWHEFAIKPCQANRQELLDAFLHFLKATQITLLDITPAIALQASQLRAAQPGLKGMDALQLSAAMHSGCTRFLTNDHRLKPLPGLTVELVEQLSA